MIDRIKKIVSGFEKRKINSLLVTNDINIKYLTGFDAHESWLFLTKKKAYYITDFRYVWEAAKRLKGVEVKQYTASCAQTLFDLAGDHKAKVVGFDENHFTLTGFKRLKAKCPKGVKLVPANGMIEECRMIKGREEIACVRQALKIHHQALLYLNSIIKPNITEQEVFLKLEKFVKARAVDFSFPPIVASGVNSCFPHASVTGRKIRANEPVLVDMGIDFKGYKSDLTRMFLLGKIPKLVRQVVDSVKEAQIEAIAQIRPGVSVSTIDQLARKALQKKDLAKHFGHSLGHGVGLDIHEAPRLSSKDKTILREGMVITVEPGVYLPAKFGVRIEDMVLVTKNGHKVLSDYID